VSVKNPIQEEWERRSHERFDVEHHVLIGRGDMASVPATVFSISLDGAALRVNDRALSRLGRLDKGDELWIDGLLPDPTKCSMVVFEGNALRVRFSAPLASAIDA